MASYDDTATVSGSVVSIENGADEVGAKSCVVTVPPTLSGVSSVSETQTGKNLFDKTAITEKSIIGHGTGVISTNNAYFVSDYIPVKSGVTYYFTGFNYWYQSYYDENKNLSETIPPNTAKATIPVGVSYLRVSGQNTNIDTAQLEIGESASTYEAFNGTTYTASLGRTIYGGTADIVNGVGTDENNKFTVTSDMSDSIRYIGSGDTAYIQINKTPASNGRWQDLVCSHFTPANIYAGGTQQGIGCYSSQFYIRDSRFTSKQDFLDFLTEQETLGTPLEICYKLATPTDFTFDGQEVPTRLGYNAFWSDSGDTELTYYKSGYGFTSVTVNKAQSKNFFPFDKNQSFLRYKQFNFRIPKGAYTISWDLISTTAETLPANMQVAYACEDGTTVYNPVTTVLGKMSRSFTLAKNVTSITIYSSTSYATSAGVTATIDNIQLELGSQATSYEPYVAPISKKAKFHRIVYGGTADVIRGTCEPKNLLKVTGEKTTYADITYTVNDKGQVMANGTATALRSFRVIKNGDPGFSFKKGVTYTLSGCPSGGSDQTYQLDLRNTNTIGTFFMNAKDYGNGVTFTPTEDAVAFPIILVRNGQVCDNLTFNPQIEVNSSKTEYAPHFDPFTFPPISMSTDDGENTLFANEGDSAITYRKAVD